MIGAHPEDGHLAMNAGEEGRVSVLAKSLTALTLDLDLAPAHIRADHTPHTHEAAVGAEVARGQRASVVGAEAEALVVRGGVKPSAAVAVAKVLSKVQ